jgi:hypothetical protein
MHTRFCGSAVRNNLFDKTEVLHHQLIGLERAHQPSKHRKYVLDAQSFSAELVLPMNVVVTAQSGNSSGPGVFDGVDD